MKSITHLPVREIVDQPLFFFGTGGFDHRSSIIFGGLYWGDDYHELT